MNIPHGKKQKTPSALGRGTENTLSPGRVEIMEQWVKSTSTEKAHPQDPGTQPPQTQAEPEHENHSFLLSHTFPQVAMTITATSFCPVRLGEGLIEGGPFLGTHSAGRRLGDEGEVEKPSDEP